MIERTLDHVGIAVASIDDSLPVWTAIVGGTPYDREHVPSQGAEIVFIGHGPGRIELVAPTADGSPVARFLKHRGPGLHHICYRVPDIRAALAAYAVAGYELVDREPRISARNHLIAFLHPRSAGGVLVELLEHPWASQPEPTASST